MKKNTKYNILIFLLVIGINFSFGQVSETFTNIPTNSSGSYQTRTWTGDDGFSWTATSSRTDQTINGKAITFRGSGGGHLINTNPIAGGCGTLTFNYKRAFSGNSVMQVFINGTQYGSNITVSSTTSSLFSQIINTAGDINIEIKNLTSGKKIVIDNLTWTSYAIATNDTDTEVYDSGAQPTGTTISSATNTDANNYINVFNMTIEDQASGDLLPTKVTNIRIKPHTTNTADWINTIQGIVIDDGTNFLAPTNVSITGTYIDITLANTDLVVADGGTKDVAIGVYLNTTNIIDNEILSFMVEAVSHGFTADSSGSDFTSSFLLGDFNSNNFTIAVEATELQITQQPTDVEENTIMTPSVIVAYTDVNGNIDTDYDGLGATATLTSLGGTALAASTTTSGTPTNGTMEFNDIAFTSPATGVTLTITDNAGITTPTIISNSFDVTGAVAGCTELFFSEYVEGSSNNKYLEIFNPTISSINLDDYTILIYGNGSLSPTTTIHFTTSASIPSNGTYVIAHSSANIWTGGAPNQTISNLNFNGNDVVVLQKSTTNIDVIGTIGNSADFAKDTTLIRKNTVELPNTTYTTSEWEVLASNTITNLGLHESNCPCTATTTYTSTGWTNGDPNITTKAIFMHNYNTSSANIEACKCEVDTGVTVTVAATSYLKVLDNITNNGTITVKNQGSVVQINDNATVIGAGTFNTEITTTNLVDEDRFTYFSSPVEAATLNDFNAWADMNYLWDFDGAIQDWHNITNTSTIMAIARGYAIQPANGSTNVTPTTTFIGPFNNGIKTQPMYFEVANAPDPMDASSVLVGNPYPSAINSNLLFQANPQLGGIYIWNHDSELGNSGNSYGDWKNNDYIVCAANNNCTDAPSNGVNATHSGFIASGQGFFATANTATPTDLEFNNAMRVTGNNTDFRRPTETIETAEKLWLNLTSTSGYFNQSLFLFSPNGTPNYNNQADAKRLGSNYGIAFYSLAANTNERLAVDDSGEFQTDITIPIGYYLNNNNVPNLTFSIDHFENLENVNIYIKDKLLNIVHDLKIADYTFNTNDTGVFDTRFDLIFNRNTLTTDDSKLANNNSLIIANNTENQIKVISSNKITNFKVFDILGKLVIETNPNTNNFSINTKIDKGTILFGKATLENGQTLFKKFIK